MLLGATHGAVLLLPLQAHIYTMYICVYMDLELPLNSLGI